MADHDSEINHMEGFLCPICKKDLFCVDELQSHFDELHSEQDYYKSLFKELFGKAKKKLLKQNGSPETSSQAQQSMTGSFNSSFEYDVNLDIGWCTNHSEFFNKMRSERIEKLSRPMNQLIIRLNKLLENMPSDLIKKKAWEQSVLPWMDGTTVTRCPNCAGQFHLARRKHHCRTCGGIMCKNCSHFLSLNTARKIVDKDLDTSENSNELHLRLCMYCMSLLESHERKRELTETFPVMGQIYNLLVEARIEAEQHLKKYLKMCHSLDAGESKYNLKDAQLLRVRLIKLAESIDSISDKIRALGEKEQGTVEGKLCTGIRMAATNFLCTRLLSLQNLPTEDQLRDKQQRRSEKIQEEMERKRLADLKQRQPSIALNESQITRSDQSDDQQVVSVGQGWVPTERKNKVNEEDDPLIEQMNIIRSYIKQAQLANREDEVISLKKNLLELKKECWKKHYSQDDTAKWEGSKEELAYADSDSPENTS